MSETVIEKEAEKKCCSHLSKGSSGKCLFALAVFVMMFVCLFVVAGFCLLDRHMTLNTVSMRMDLLQQRQDLLATQIDLLRRGGVGGASSSSSFVAPLSLPDSTATIEITHNPQAANTKPEPEVPFVPPKPSDLYLGK